MFKENIQQASSLPPGAYEAACQHKVSESRPPVLTKVFWTQIPENDGSTLVQTFSQRIFRTFVKLF